MAVKIKVKVENLEGLGEVWNFLVKIRPKVDLSEGWRERVKC